MKLRNPLKTSPEPAKLDQLEIKAESEIEEVDESLERLSSLHAHVELEEAAKKVVEGVSHVLDYLGALAALHPIAGIVVEALKKVVDLERQRHENHAHIVVVHGTMVKTVYHVRFLARIQNKFEQDVKEKLEVLFKHMVATINEFGGFVQTYHTCWQKTYKVIFSHIHKRKLEHFGDRFKQHREDLDEMRKTMTQLQLANVVDNTEKILRRLRIDDPDVEKAEEFMRDCGGPDVVRQDPKLIDELAKILGESATLAMKQNLRQGFDEILEKNTARYMKMLEGVQDAVMSSITTSQSVILGRLNKGPHELIEDVDVRKIWEDNRWKSSVKCRVFVEGLHEYYQQSFHKYSSESRVPHKDAWTLDFFSRVMYHSAIGDVVDDDGSGYISASEVNDFISEQRGLGLGWTIPQWFAFWACGWYNNNAWYYRRIQHLVKHVEHALQLDTRTRQPDVDDLWKPVRTIVLSLKRLVLVADVEDFSGTLKVPHQLRHLQEEYRTYEEKRIADGLSFYGPQIVDRPSLSAVVGDSRIELHMMPLLYILMERLQDTIGAAVMSTRPKDSQLIAIEALATSCIAVVSAFEDRMHDLVRGWRFESKDVDMQIDRYADGLFRKCFREAHVYKQEYDTLCTSIFGSEHKLPRHLRPFESFQHRSKTTPDDLAHEMTALSARVVALESRLPVLEDVRTSQPLSRWTSRSTAAQGEPISSSSTARSEPVKESHDGVAKLDARTSMDYIVAERLQMLADRIAALDGKLGGVENFPKESVAEHPEGSELFPGPSPWLPGFLAGHWFRATLKPPGHKGERVASIAVLVPWVYATIFFLIWTLAVVHVSRW